MAFDPDKYVEKTIYSQGSKGFDPDKYLQESEKKSDDKLLSASGLGRGFLKATPAAGAMFGGALGSAAGPVGTLTGAGLGAMAGYAGQKLAESGLFNETPNRKEYYTGLAKSGLEGAAGEAGGMLLSKALPVVGRAISIQKEKPNADSIMAASKELGIEPTPGMLSESPYLQKIESSLEQSPSIGGMLARRKITPVRKGISEAAESIFKDVANVPPSTTGAAVKKGLVDKIEKRLEPISELYDSVRQSTSFIDVNPKSLNRVSQNILDSEKFASSPAFSLTRQVAEDLKMVKTVDDLKALRSMVGKRLGARNIDPVEYGSLANIYGKLSNLEKNTTIRAALEQAKNTKEGKQIAKEIIGDLKSANKQYKGLIGELKDIASGTGVSKNVKNIDSFISKIDEIPDEKIVDKLFAVKNRKSLNDLKKSFPEEFESLRMAKLDQIRKSAEVAGEVSPKKLLSAVKNVEPETRELLFGKDYTKVLKNLETVVNAGPPMVGPSGTPAGIEWMNFLNPLALAGREIPRLGQYGIWQGSQGINAASKGLINLPKTSTGALLRQSPKMMVGE